MMVRWGVGTFLQRLWITLAILASCGLSGLSHASPAWILEGPARSAFAPMSDLYTQASLARHSRSAAKRPSGKAETLAGPRLQDLDGDGPDPLQPALTHHALAWFAPETTGPVERPEAHGRIPKGLAPEAGGKRGPPAA